MSILYFNLQILFSHLLNDGSVLFSDCTRYHSLSEPSQSVPLRCPSPFNQLCNALFYQKIQVPNLEESCTLCSAVLGWNSDSRIHRPYPSILAIHRWRFLHFRHLNMSVIVQFVRPRPHAKRLIQDTSASSWDAETLRRMTEGNYLVGENIHLKDWAFVVTWVAAYWVCIYIYIDIYNIYIYVYHIRWFYYNHWFQFNNNIYNKWYNTCR